jgi:DNA mismatch repair protein MutL
MPIKIMPPELASQIAAGEVIERPASVVKELLENSLDADATRISINIQDAGKKLIEIQDNGTGIQKEEISLAAERHSTSKLFSSEQLNQISTLGFRGEALASISSVSRMQIRSRTRDSNSGGFTIIEAGKKISSGSIGIPVGTIVTISDLFRNVPARLKFLKHERTERRWIQQTVERYALANPEIKVTLRMENRIAFQSSGNGDQREIIGMVFDVETARKLLDLISKDSDLSIKGFTSGTSITRSNRRSLNFYINGRPVQDSSISAAVMKAYQNTLMVNRYPICILFIQMPADQVDVNVHPTKAEVRFKNQDRIFTGIQSAVRRALLAHSPVPDMDLSPNWFPTSGENRSQDPTWQMLETSSRTSIISGETGMQDHEGFIGSSSGHQRDQAAFRGSGMRILKPVGQLAASYLVAEGPDGMYLIDQHAAHERILFEQFSLDQTASIPSQTLLQPETCDLNESDTQSLLEYMDSLDALGFHLEPFGERAFIIRAIPAMLGDLEPSRALRILLDDFEEDETPLQNHLREKLIARICKKASIKAGKVLSMEEQQALIDGLEACRAPRTCPHGRPTMIHLSVDLLEKQFGRKGAR